MSELKWLAERFEDNRPRLRALAYRMLGSASEAEDAVQEAWLRLDRSGGKPVENLGGWLTTVVARVWLDTARSRRSRREEPRPMHLPEAATSRGNGSDPEQAALLADSVGSALLVVLATLGPAERVAFVLHDMFGMPFEEIAGIVGRFLDGGQAAGEPGAATGAGRSGRGGRGGPEPQASGRRR